MDTERYIYRRSASRITVVAHFFGILAFILLLVWLLHYREGIEYGSTNPDRVFNVHPLLMFLGVVFLSGQAIMAYKTVPGDRMKQKTTHMILNLLAICLGIVGLCAVFKFHDMMNLENVYTLHSWIGIGTFCLLGLQWLFGLFTFMLSRASHDARARMVPWHMAGGRALFFMVICAALTGLMERFTLLNLSHQREARLVNVIGLAILLFGVSVDLSVALGRYV